MGRKGNVLGIDVLPRYLSFTCEYWSRFSKGFRM